MTVTTDTVLWEPPADIRETSRIGRYLSWLEAERGLVFADYAALWEWSVTDLTGFWQSIWDYFEVVAHDPPEAVLGDTTMPGARWFPGATLNYAENLLRMPGRADDETVVHAYSQSREPVRLTARQLRDQVRRVRAGLKARGVGKGDRVAAYAPNIPETYVLMLATASLGAIFSSCAPEFGARSVIDRWSQIEPRVLVATDGYRYGDKAISREAEISEIAEAIPSIEHVITIGYLHADGGDWDQLDGDDEMAFEPVPFDHPLYVLYSSGTTGLPKPIVHGHGGILLEHLKTLALHHDLGPDDRFFWFTTTGWMMWNFLVSGPLVGSSIVLFDGNPGWPDLTALWDLVDTAGITYFGTSAPFLMACRKAGLTPRKRLKGVGSTGAPLPAEGFAWVYEAVGSDLQLLSLSGGTDVCTGFVGGAPLLPVRAGVIAGRILGARVEAYDASGKPVIGELGELVITAPMPSMPVGFWGDTDGSRYREAYFDVFPGVWRHGDWITIAEDGSCVITGRSDATLNRGGVRLGTAEFYSVVESLPEVVDSLVVHLDKPDDPNGELLLFVVLTEGTELDDALRGRIARELRAALSPRHVPDAAYQVRALPHTLSGKKLEVPVKRILTGTPVESAAAKGALANPESLTAFADLAAKRE
ncbi:putative acyl-CoA synthetase [Actinoplanes missouriensis 431]|uniref:Putative acyl-CoA synthetase n=1 Tax=Actinoplanes missouriensis (strain ATCC 14538 / DSM 43046 / CBS 188.64 / JCM 3121 / NBRC 102363 / NCIMB 12654 / NRRL B-3342 / UNCC 431) TaxID=512565 RepID=I0GZ81_ACTM4|nr:acetoacetate--CoA ligase [Actinoplanes missouriensis]BAL86068.1 putative acyl-CoA synthetase [Actinoplanes missouriensis 431]